MGSSKIKTLEVLDSLLESAYLLKHTINTSFKDEPVSYQQYLVLKIIQIHHPKPVSIKLIKENMMDHNSDVTRIIEKLASKGLVYRDRSPVDARSTVASLPDDVFPKLKKWDKRMKKISKTLKMLSQKERRTLNDLQDKLSDELTKF